MVIHSFYNIKNECTCTYMGFVRFEAKTLLIEYCILLKIFWIFLKNMEKNELRPGLMGPRVCDVWGYMRLYFTSQ